MSLLKSAGNIYFAYQFLTKLTTPFNKTEAYKLGIIDEEKTNEVTPQGQNVVEKNHLSFS